MKKYTRQQLFDKVAGHLLKQGKRSETADGNLCKYRNGNFRCAVGCLIPDELYCPQIDFDSRVDGTAGAAMTTIPEDDSDALLHQILWEAGVAADGLKLLLDLQQVHDNSEVEQWRQLRQVATRWNLSKEVLGCGA